MHIPGSGDGTTPDIDFSYPAGAEGRGMLEGSGYCDNFVAWKAKMSWRKGAISVSVTVVNQIVSVRAPTAWTIARHDGPNHLGL